NLLIESALLLAFPTRRSSDLRPLEFFAERLRDGAAQVYYPEVTFVYYSGECQRVSRLIGAYRRHFERLTREPESDRQRPLFVQRSEEHTSELQSRFDLVCRLL